MKNMKIKKNINPKQSRRRRLNKSHVSRLHNIKALKIKKNLRLNKLYTKKIGSKQS